jgi:hypothetical protein
VSDVEIRRICEAARLASKAIAVGVYDAQGRPLAAVGDEVSMSKAAVERIHFDGSVTWDLADGRTFFAQLIAERRILVAVLDQKGQLAVARAQLKKAADEIRRIV